MKATNEPPKEPGWYWFRADDNTPTTIRHLPVGRWIVLWVGHARDGITPSVHFPMGSSYIVEEMAGSWCGPLKDPGDA